MQSQTETAKQSVISVVVVVAGDSLAKSIVSPRGCGGLAVPGTTMVSGLARSGRSLPIDVDDHTLVTYPSSFPGQQNHSS